MARKTPKPHACSAYGHGRYTDAGWAFHSGWCKYAAKKAARTSVAEPVKPVIDAEKLAAAITKAVLAVLAS